VSLFYYLNSVLKKYSSKNLECLVANPADDGSGIKQLEELVLQVQPLNSICLFLCLFGGKKKEFDKKVMH
jgi:hypothetical protein